MLKNTCCFIGHRTIEETEELRRNLYETIDKLIVEEGIDTFLFGSKSRFNTLCLEIVSEIKQKYPHIKRIYVRSEYPVIDDDYKNYLLKYYEDTYYPKRRIGSGRAVYVERNCEMIKNSRICVFYYSKENAPDKRKSGTEIALAYAKGLKKTDCQIAVGQGVFAAMKFPFGKGLLCSFATMRFHHLRCRASRSASSE